MTKRTRKTASSESASKTARWTSNGATILSTMEFITQNCKSIPLDPDEYNQGESLDDIDYEQIKIDCQNESVSRNNGSKIGF